MIDYKRVTRAKKGVEHNEPEPEVSVELALERCRKLVEIQKDMIRRLQRLLGQGLTFEKRK